MVSWAIVTFATTLQRLREAAGYPSARAFFLRSGGPRFFGCTYKQYRNAEAGRSLPSPRLADRVAEALRLEASPPAARRFMDAYLRELLGSERLAAMAFGAGPHGSSSAVDSAMTRAFEKPRHLSRAQTEFFYRTAEAYWAFVVLTTDSAPKAPEDLAKLSGLPAPRLKPALEGLVKHGLAERERGGRYRSPLVDEPIMSSPDHAGQPRYLALTEKHLGLDKGRDEVFLRQHVLVRASAGELEHYKPLLIRALQGAGVFSTTESGPDTGLFLVEAKVRKVADY